jgi:hypothetical protein
VIDIKSTYAIEVLEVRRDETLMGAVYAQGHILVDNVSAYAFLVQPGYTPAIWSTVSGCLLTNVAELTDVLTSLLLAVLTASTPNPEAPPIDPIRKPQDAWIRGLEAGYDLARTDLAAADADRRLNWYKTLTWPDVAEEIAHGRR